MPDRILILSMSESAMSQNLMEGKPGKCCATLSLADKSVKVLHHRFRSLSRWNRFVTAVQSGQAYAQLDSDRQLLGVDLHITRRIIGIPNQLSLAGAAGSQ